MTFSRPFSSCMIFLDPKFISAILSFFRTSAISWNFSYIIFYKFSSQFLCFSTTKKSGFLKLQGNVEKFPSKISTIGHCEEKCIMPKKIPKNNSGFRNYIIHSERVDKLHEKFKDRKHYMTKIQNASLSSTKNTK